MEEWMSWMAMLAGKPDTPGIMAIHIGMIVVAAIVLSLLIRRLLVLIERQRVQVLALPAEKVLAASFGLLIGLLIGWLGALVIAWWPSVYEIVRTFLMLTLGYLGLRIGYERAGELLYPEHRRVRYTADYDHHISKDSDKIIKELPDGAQEVDLMASRMPAISIMDANIAIDGRIEGIIACGFVQGIVIVPDFIVQELQAIADSADTLRRQRGKKGLDTLTKLRDQPSIELEVASTHYSDNMSADERLVQLAAARKAALITNDRNLQQIAELHGIRILSVNRLAALLKPQLMAGELLYVQMTRAGKEPGQGIAYLDDGTMIVVEQGKDHIGQELEVIVTSVLQTSNGKMVFARPHTEEHSE